ncbi:hypothetical protein [uncultured Microbulbifer sp.]|uniref:hypothetical protein n=1 Tax=uncultured Microbulbifer sp. TaxID=348147 RepID=UPI002632BFA8|nr:hypothetical protein [uncultured Microbulbifer sp.]
MRAYKHRNGRIQHRSRGGQFRRSTLLDVGITNGCHRARQCQCGHVWHPIVTTGICPECDEQNSKPAPLTEEEKLKLAEYSAIPDVDSIDPRDHKTLNEKQKLWVWLNNRGVFHLDRE